MGTLTSFPYCSSWICNAWFACDLRSHRWPALLHQHRQPYNQRISVCGNHHRFCSLQESETITLEFIVTHCVETPLEKYYKYIDFILFYFILFSFIHIAKSHPMVNLAGIANLTEVTNSIAISRSRYLLEISWIDVRRVYFFRQSKNESVVRPSDIGFTESTSAGLDKWTIRCWVRCCRVRRHCRVYNF